MHGIQAQSINWSLMSRKFIWQKMSLLQVQTEPEKFSPTWILRLFPKNMRGWVVGRAVNTKGLEFFHSIFFHLSCSKNLLSTFYVPGTVLSPVIWSHHNTAFLGWTGTSFPPINLCFQWFSSKCDKTKTPLRCCGPGQMGMMHCLKWTRAPCFSAACISEAPAWFWSFTGLLAQWGRDLGNSLPWNLAHLGTFLLQVWRLILASVFISYCCCNRLPHIQRLSF